MFEKLRVPNLGVVENMSYFICSNCKQRHEIFAHGGAAAAASAAGVPLLGEIPLDPRIREGGDQGRPPATVGVGDALASAYFDAAQRMAAQLSDLNAARPEPLPVL
jgi:ATP-binding protein involved in chromosome partitioning